MKQKIFSILLFLTCVALPHKVQAQDIHMSQFYEASILRNPALTGVFEGDYKTGVMYRSQWGSISNPFSTAIVSGEFRIAIGKSVTDYLSLGFLTFYDKAGSLSMTTLSIYPGISYSKAMSTLHHTYLSVGFMGGYIQRSYNTQYATYNNQYQNGYDPTIPSGENLPNPKLSNWDVGAGVNLSGTGGAGDNMTYSVGVAGYHFTQPKTSFYNNNLIQLPIKWDVNTDMSWKLEGPYTVQLHANYLKQDAYQELILGGLISWNRMGADEEDRFSIYGGAYFRVGDALVPTVKVDYMHFSLALSYDVNISELRAASALKGGYELSLFLKGFYHKVDGPSSKTLCPGFW
jgi:type IX secretion system PorP/SprF family membrane protein